MGVGTHEQYLLNDENLELLSIGPHKCWFLGLIELCNYVKNVELLAEIGSYQGESTSLFSKYLNPTIIWCVDPWENGYDKEDSASQVFKMSDVEHNFDERNGSDKTVRKIKRTSKEASEKFPDEFLDMVYIDANHQYESVLEDIQLWLPKITSGGFISGHDWEGEPIMRAVIETVGKPDKIFQDSSWVKKV